jgi:hypothetical protein
MMRHPLPGRRLGRRRVTYLTPLFLIALGACSDSATGPGEPTAEDIVVLNSIGQTLANFSIAETVEASGSPVDLGAGFDGDAFDLTSSFAVTTVSSFGGSRVLFVDLVSGSVLTSSFPAPEADLANPSAASFDPQGIAWVAGRGSDAVYRLSPGDPLAERIATQVGTFVERVVPVGERLYAVDANIDDDGGSYQPLGPGRIVVLSRSGVEEEVIDLPDTAFNPTDAVETRGKMVVLAAGTFDAGTFLPSNDGALVVIDLEGRVAGPAVALAANGVSLELGADGSVYVTTTTDYQTLNLLRFDPASGSFVRGPANPIVVLGGNGRSVDCWSATALDDGRIACTTFSFAEAGRLVLADREGSFIDEVASGFGSTDVALR